MRLLITALLGLLPLASSALATQLFTDVPQTVTVRPQTKEVLLTGLTFPVLPGARKITIDLETEDPSHDLDLYVRAGAPISQEGSILLADYSSVNAGSGVERIVVDSATDPPLQTGIHYLGLKVNTLNTLIEARITITIETGGRRTTFLISTFTNPHREDWDRNFPASDLPGASPGDFAGVIAAQPGGFLRLNDLNGPNQDFARAPAKFLGNLADFSDARFEFDYRHSSGATPLFRIEMRLLGAGAAFRWRGPIPPANEWRHVVVRLEESNWTRIAGDASFQDALRNIQGIELSMDQAPGAESNDLDNFAFLGEPPAPPTGGPEGPASSTFESALDGWTHNYPPVGIVGASVGTVGSAVSRGTPGQGSEGFLLMGDSGDLGEDFAVAPPKYLGDLSQLDRPWIEFDFRQIQGGFAQLPVQMLLIGSGSVYRSIGARPRQSWEHFRFPLLDDYWVHMTGEASFEQVLSRVERIEISMDMVQGPEVNGLDNFHLRTGFTAPVGRALQVDRNEVNLAGLVGDPVFPNETIEVTSMGGEVDWMAHVEPAAAAWLRLSANSGTTPGEISLTVDPSGLPAGEHHAEVVLEAEEFGVPGQSITVVLTLTDSGTTPRIHPNGVVNAADASLGLSPGALASVYGRNFSATGRDADFLPGEDRLPAELLGVEVLILDASGNLIAAAPLLYVGPGQVNFQMPFEVAGLDEVQIVVSVNGVRSPAEPVEIVPAAPALFVLAGGRAAVLNSDFRLNTSAQPAERGTVVMAFLTGVGEVSPEVATGRAAPDDPLAEATAETSATIGGRPARVVALVLAPGLIGVGQANIEIPADLEPGEHELRLQVGDRESNGAIISVR